MLDQVEFLKVDIPEQVFEVGRDRGLHGVNYISGWVVGGSWYNLNSEK